MSKNLLYTIPLIRRKITETPRVEGFERGRRPHRLIFKVFAKLSEMYSRIDEEYHVLFNKQMFGQEQGDYNPHLWEKIQYLETLRARMSGAIAALRWVLQLSDAIGLDYEKEIRISQGYLDEDTPVPEDIWND